MAKQKNTGADTRGTEQAEAHGPRCCIALGRGGLSPGALSGQLRSTVRVPAPTIQYKRLDGRKVTSGISRRRELHPFMASAA
jgi:hypothetical protein